MQCIREARSATLTDYQGTSGIVCIVALGIVAYVNLGAVVKSRCRFSDELDSNAQTYISPHVRQLPLLVRLERGLEPPLHCEK